MKQICLATAIGVALALAAQSAPAQTSSPTVCKTLNGRLVCQEASRPTGAAGSHAYERWQDGSRATEGGSTTAPPPLQAKPRFHSYIGGYNAGYGFGK